MELNDKDLTLVREVAQGLPLASRPYQAIAARAGMTEAEVIARLRRMTEAGIINRFGVIVRHHELGYRANGMAVWDIPDSLAADIGRKLSACEGVTLCYRRPRRLPDWPYNLFCMVHGRDRAVVEGMVERLKDVCDLHGYAHDLLFSLRRFKQTGAAYGRQPAAGVLPELAGVMR